MPNYGIESPYTTSDSELFTEIDDTLQQATRRSTYQPYFEMFQQGATQEYFNNLNKQGMTGGGQSTGFAGSTASGTAGSGGGTFMNAMMQQFGQQIFKAEDDIGKKMQRAQSSITDIIQSNRQTALSLKALEDSGGGGGGKK